MLGKIIFLLSLVTSLVFSGNLKIPDGPQGPPGAILKVKIAIIHSNFIIVWLSSTNTQSDLYAVK